MLGQFSMGSFLSTSKHGRPRRHRTDVAHETRTTRANEAFQMIVTDALHSSGYGTVTCLPCAALTPPLHVEWLIDGVPVDEPVSTLGLDSSHLHARRVPVGSVEMRVRDAEGDVAVARCEVDRVPLPCVVGYEVKHASSGVSRDGHVRAIVERPPSDVAYLWTSGVVTREPSLSYLSTGTYAVTLVSSSSATSTANVAFVHACPAARVDVVPPA